MFSNPTEFGTWYIANTLLKQHLMTAGQDLDSLDYVDDLDRDLSDLSGLDDDLSDLSDACIGP